MDGDIRTMGSRVFQQMVAAGVSAAIGLGPAPLHAQTAPAVPPDRVGRLANLSGTVSERAPGATQWSPAAANLPMAAGAALWTEPAAHAELDATGIRFTLDSSTELDVAALDDRSFTVTLPEGAVCVHVAPQPQGVATIVQTPRGQVAFTEPGRYELTAGGTEAPTTVTAVDGAAAVTAPGLQAAAAANQTVAITGDGATTPFAAAVQPAQHDPFLAACLAADTPARPRAAAIPATVPLMTGGYELEQTGEWATTPDDGPVWYPPATPDFVPYRQGHWGYLAPWGWTWIDDAPWGFAPTHYGRWLQVGSRWGWLPGAPVEAAPAYPVFAPAIVTFLAGAALGGAFSHGPHGGRDGGGPNVGWVPLGPHEPYYPPFRAPDTYVRNVNINHVQNVTNVVTQYHTVLRPGGAFPIAAPLANRAAATAIPAAIMASSQQVAPAARPLPGGAFTGAAPFVARPPVAPRRRHTRPDPRRRARVPPHPPGHPRRPRSRSAPRRRRPRRLPRLPSRRRPRPPRPPRPRRRRPHQRRPPSHAGARPRPHRNSRRRPSRPRALRTPH